MKNQKGFTLIELVMVIAILGILAAVAIPKYIDLKTKADQAAADGLAGAIASAASATYAASQAGVGTYATATACSTTSAYLATANFGSCTVALATNTCTVTCGAATSAVTLP